MCTDGGSCCGTRPETPRPAWPTTWDDGSSTLVPRPDDAGLLAWKRQISVFAAKIELGEHGWIERGLPRMTLKAVPAPSWMPLTPAAPARARASCSRFSILVPLPGGRTIFYPDDRLEASSLEHKLVVLCSLNW